MITARLYHLQEPEMTKPEVGLTPLYECLLPPSILEAKLSNVHNSLCSKLNLVVINYQLNPKFSAIRIVGRSLGLEPRVSTTSTLMDRSISSPRAPMELYLPVAE